MCEPPVGPAYNPPRGPVLFPLSFPKIISARIDDEDPPERVWRQWFRFAGPPDVEEHPSATPCACALGCSMSHRRREFAAGALRQKAAFVSALPPFATMSVRAPSAGLGPLSDMACQKGYGLKNEPPRGPWSVQFCVRRISGSASEQHHYTTIAQFPRILGTWTYCVGRSDFSQVQFPRGRRHCERRACS